MLHILALQPWRDCLDQFVILGGNFKDNKRTGLYKRLGSLHLGWKDAAGSELLIINFAGTITGTIYLNSGK